MLRKFGVVTLNPGWVKDGEILEPQAVSQTIKTLIQSVKTKRKNVATGIFGAGVIVKRISMAPIEENLIAEAIKWEAEQYTGLDEFLTKRSYRTTLTGVKNDLNKLSKFIGSGYALEITRRKGNDDSKDWRYDKDTFIICVKIYVVPIINLPRIVPEMGNVTNPQNIIDPDSLYNYRISPVRNAMRWMNKILVSYRQFNPDAKIIFTDGDGNYFAEGEMQSALCRLEAGIVAENQTLNSASFGDSDNAKPFLLPERVLYDYPMNSREYRRIKNNPYGAIYFENSYDSGLGYIDSMKYKPEEGMAFFNLIPTNRGIAGGRGILTEDGIQITTENNIDLIT